MPHKARVVIKSCGSSGSCCWSNRFHFRAAITIVGGEVVYVIGCFLLLIFLIARSRAAAVVWPHPSPVNTPEHSAILVLSTPPKREATILTPVV